MGAQVIATANGTHGRAASAPIRTFSRLRYVKCRERSSFASCEANRYARPTATPTSQRAEVPPCAGARVTGEPSSSKSACPCAPLARVLSEPQSGQHRGMEAVSHRAMIDRARAAQRVLERIVVLGIVARDPCRLCPESGACMRKEEPPQQQGARASTGTRSWRSRASDATSTSPSPTVGSSRPQLHISATTGISSPASRAVTASHGAHRMRVPGPPQISQRFRRGDRRHLAVGHGARR